MRPKLCICFLPLLLFSAVSCCKVDPEVTIPVSAIKVGIPGPLTNLQVFAPPTSIIVDPNSKETMAFDVNEDGIDDIEFNAVYTAYFHMDSDHSRSAVKSLHDSLEIAIRSHIDTTYTCTELFQGKTYILTYTDPQFHSCSGSEAIDTATNKYPGIYHHGDLLAGDYAWQAGEFLLTGYSYANSGFIGGDTVEIIQRYTGTWGAMEEKYLLFRIKETTGSVYGWFKITATKSSVLIFELAYQEI